MRVLLLVLHIVGVGTWLGANVAQLITTRRLVGRGGQVAAAWMDTVVLWGRILYMPASILILATGVALVLDSTVYEFSQAFVSIGFAAVILAAVLGMTVFVMGGRQAAAAFNAGDGAAGNAQVGRLISWGMVDTAVLVFAIIAMVGKWGV
jgi:hypothetical protein